MKNIPQSTILAFLLAMLFQNIHAQKDYKNGFVITKSNDTIHGVIEFKGDISSAKKCIFLKEGASEKIEYTANEIQAYRIEEGKFYISKKIKSEDTEEVLFLEYLIKGVVNVYYFRDAVKDHYYIEKSGEDLYELKNDTREEYINNVKYANESNAYKGVLKYVFQDSPKTCKEVDNLSLNHGSMIKIAKDYHNEVCSGEQCIVFEKKKTKIKVKFGPMLGINTYKINFPEFKCKSTIYPSLGLFLKFSMPSFNKGLSFQYEINYSKKSLEGIYPQPIYNKAFNPTIIGYKNIKVSLNLSSVKNSGILRYQFSTGKISPVILVGLFADYYLKSEYIDKPPIENPSISNFDYGLVMGGGCSYIIFKKHEINLDLNYNMGKGFDQYSAIPELDDPEITNRVTVSSENHTRSFTLNLSYSL